MRSLKPAAPGMLAGTRRSCPATRRSPRVATACGCGRRGNSLSSTVATHVLPASTASGPEVRTACGPLALAAGAITRPATRRTTSLRAMTCVHAPRPPGSLSPPRRTHAHQRPAVSGSSGAQPVHPSSCMAKRVRASLRSSSATPGPRGCERTVHTTLARATDPRPLSEAKIAGRLLGRANFSKLLARTPYDRLSPAGGSVAPMNSSRPARAWRWTFPRSSGVQPRARPAGPSACRAQA